MAETINLILRVQIQWLQAPKRLIAANQLVPPPAHIARAPLAPSFSNVYTYTCGDNALAHTHAHTPYPTVRRAAATFTSLNVIPGLNVSLRV